jgi:hypothetical protein
LAFATPFQRRDAAGFWMAAFAGIIWEARVFVRETLNFER